MSDAAYHEARRILRGFQWTYASVALQGILKLAALMVLARLLTPHDFGLLSFALLCTNFVERIGQGGMAPVIVQLQEVSADVISTAWWLSVALGVLSVGVVSGSAHQVALFFGEPALASIIRALSIGCFLEAITAIPEALLQRNLQCREIMLADNLAYFVSMLGICTWLALSGWGVWSLVVSHLTLKIIRLIVILISAPQFEVGCLSRGNIEYLVRMGFGFSLGRLLNFFSLQGDNFVVGRILGTDALGMYNRAYQLMALPAMYVGQVFERVMFPAMARRQSDPKQLAHDFLLALEVLSLVALPAGVVMFLLAEEIVLVGFGERWRSITPVVSILSFGVFFRTAYKCSDTAVRSVGAVYHYAGRQALYAALVIAGAGIGAMFGGVAGVASGVVVAVGINYVSMTWLSIRLLDVSVSQVLRAHLIGLWVTLFVGLALVGSIGSIRATTQLSLAVLIIAGMVAVIAWLLSFAIAAAYVPFGCMVIVRRFFYHWAPRLTGARAGQYHPDRPHRNPQIQQ